MLASINIIMRTCTYNSASALRGIHSTARHKSIRSFIIKFCYLSYCSYSLSSDSGSFMVFLSLCFTVSDLLVWVEECFFCDLIYWKEIMEYSQNCWIPPFPERRDGLGKDCPKVAFSKVCLLRVISCSSVINLWGYVFFFTRCPNKWALRTDQSISICEGESFTGACSAITYYS